MNNKQTITASDIWNLALAAGNASTELEHSAAVQKLHKALRKFQRVHGMPALARMANVCKMISACVVPVDIGRNASFVLISPDKHGHYTEAQALRRVDKKKVTLS